MPALPPSHFALRPFTEARPHLDLRLPVRAVFAVNNKRFDSQGWLAQPQVDLNLRSLVPGWSLSLQGSLFFGDRAYHAYYYDVAPQYATAERSAYRSVGGYGGKQILMALSRRRGDRLPFGSRSRPACGPLQSRIQRSPPGPARRTRHDHYYVKIDAKVARHPST